MIVDDEAPEVFSKESYQISVDDAYRMFNASNFEPFTTSKTIKAATKEYIQGIQKLPVQAQAVMGQVAISKGQKIKELGELVDKVLPEGNVIFNGKSLVNVGNKIQEMGMVNIRTANRNLEEFNKQARKVIPTLTEEERDSWTYNITQGGLNYGTMLGLSVVNPELGLGYISAITMGSETEEGLETYKRKHKGSLEGYEKQATQDLAFNTANTAVQTILERAFGVPAQLKFFKGKKQLLKTGFGGFVEEFTTENLQNITDAVADALNGRFEGIYDKDGNPMTVWAAVMEQMKGTIVAGMFGGGAGVSFAVYNRAVTKNMIRDNIRDKVEPEKLEDTVNTIYDLAATMEENAVAQETENTSSLRAKRGEVFENLYNSALQAVNDARAKGAFQELETEEDVANYVQAESQMFADWVLEEANRRNTTTQNVLDTSTIQYRDGKLEIGMTKGVTSEERTLNMFVGENALTANKESQRLAENMELNDYTPEEIWRETGWKRGKEGKWKFEISDEDAQEDFSNAPTDTEVALGDVFQHEKLYKAYPSIKNMPVLVDSTLVGSGIGAMYENGRIRVNPESFTRKDLSLKGTLLHEIQHAVQRIEGFAVGGSPSYFAQKDIKETLKVFFQEEDTKKFNQAVIDALYSEISVDAANKIADADEKLIDAAKKYAETDEDVAELEGLYDDANEALNEALMEAGKTPEWLANIKKEARKSAELDEMGRSVRAKLYNPDAIYKRLYGEREARTTTDRMDMTEEERRANYPEYEKGSLVITQLGDVMELALDNERLDAENPEYTGETINIDGVEKTVYNSNGDRIAKSELALRNFYKWFGDSKVVDEQGRPLVVYHGTSAEFDTFRKGNIFTTDNQEVASEYGSLGAMPLYMKLENPFIVDAYGQSFGEIYNAEGMKKAYKDLTEEDYKKLADTFFDGDIKEAKEWYPQNEQGEVNLARAYGEKPRATNEWADYARKEGYDGVIIKDVNDTVDISNIRTTDYVAFESNQIKSTSNRGTFDINEDNIYHQDERAMIQFKADKALISLTEKADSAGIPHELAHYYLQNMFLFAKSGKASQEYMDYYNKIAEYLDISQDQETIQEWQQEKWARAYELYRQGRTPEGLEAPMNQYNRWIRKAYGKMQEPMYQDKDGKMVVPELDFDTMKTFAELAGEELTESQFKENQERVRGLAKSTNEMAKAKGIETELPTYEKRSSTEMGKKADEFIKKDKQLAIDIVKGLKPEQEGIFRQDLYAALRELALNEGDSDLLNELSRSMTVEEATELGQRIQALSRGRIDPVKQMVELRDERMKKNKTDKKKVKEETEKATKEIKKEIAEAATPKEWADFIKSLEC